MEAWTDFCDRLRALGETIEGDAFPSGPRDRAEGFRYLSRLAVFALQWHVEFADPDFPAFYRFEDDVVKWGGPNVDNQYLRAKVEGSGTYRITGNVTGLREMIVSTPEGDMQLGRYRVFEERNLAQLDVEADGSLEVILSATAHEGNWIPLHPEVDHVLVRQYVSDWEHDPVVQLRIERVGNEGAAPAPLTPDGVATALDRAATWIEHSVVYWNDYMRAARARVGDNVLSPPNCPPGGARDIYYGGGGWSLAPGEALLIECDAPAAQYWSIQLYSEGWFESLDAANRQNSLSGHQMHVDDDGRWRAVVAHEDPGVPNWLDTEGHAGGLVSYRWVRSTTMPVPTASVVALAELRKHLPPGTPTVTAEDRRRAIAVRQASIARRFRG